MKITTIQHSNSKEYFQLNGLKEWKGFIVTVELGEGEDPHKAKDELVTTMESWHNKLSNSPQYSNTGSSYAGAMDGSGAREAINPTIDHIIDDLNQCTAIDSKNGLGVQLGLIAFEHLCATPRIKEAYDKKLKELQNKQ